MSKALRYQSVTFRGKPYNNSIEAFRDIHSEIEKYMKKNNLLVEQNKLEKEKIKAEIIEKGLKKIKIGIKDNPQDPFIQEIIKNIQVKNESIFQQYSDINYHAGIQFEKELEGIVNYFFKPQEDTMVQLGGQLGTAGAKFTKDELMDKIFPWIKGKKYDKNRDKILANLAKKSIDLNGNECYTLSEKMIKTDISVPKGFQIDLKANIDKDILDAIKLLEGKNISAKNVNSEVHLSTTKWNRIYASTLKEIGGADSEIADLFYKTAYYKKGGKDPEIELHKYHLRYLYDLTGAGIKINGEDASLIDYLIVNQRNGEDLKVFSVQELLSDAFKREKSVNNIYIKIWGEKSE